MNTPSFLESHVSQIPAIQLLQQLGFAYLSSEETAVECGGRLGRALFWGLRLGTLGEPDAVAKGSSNLLTNRAVRFLFFSVIPERVPDLVTAPCRPPAGSDLRAFLCPNSPQP